MNSFIWMITITAERWVFSVESVEMVVEFWMSSPKLKNVHWSALLRLLILSSSLGLSISEYISRPVDPDVHLFSQTSLNLFLRICFTEELLQGLLGWSFCVPSFANWSACSLPWMSVCLGIHCRVISACFQKVEKKCFKYWHKECYAKIWKLYVERCGCNRKDTYIHTNTQTHTYCRT